MNEVRPSPWACSNCKTTAITFADEAVWCPKCEKKLLDVERFDISRGEQHNTPTPDWTPVPLE